jgi:hypothetical protein
VFISDRYTTTSGISLEGTSLTLQTAPQYNELSSFPTSFSLQKLYSLPPIVWILVLIPFLIAATFLIYVRPKDDSQNQRNKNLETFSNKDPLFKTSFISTIYAMHDNSCLLANTTTYQKLWI